MNARHALPLLSLALLTAASLSAAALSAAAQPAPPADGVERFDGSFRLAGSLEQSTRVLHRAIDHAVEPMGAIIRDIAAGQIRDRVRVVERIVLAVSEPRASVTFDGRRTFRSPLGQWQFQQLDGRPVRVQIRARNGALVQLIRGENGSQRVVYRLRPDGSLAADFTIQSERLPRDLRYQLTYRRAAGAR